MRLSAVSVLFPASLVVVLLTGCGMGARDTSLVPVAGVALKGMVHGGQQPVTNSQIFAYAAGSTGTGVNAVSLLENPVYSDLGGNWFITGDYTCPSASSEVYLVAVGGNPGMAAGTNNTAIRMVAPIGQCGTLNSNTFVIINEVTTVAAAYALAGFLDTYGEVGSSSTNVTGLQNAFATVNNLVDPSSGMARLVTPGGHGIAPQQEINTAADALAACVNSGAEDSVPCGLLFDIATDAEGNYPTDTFGAIINVAHNPSTDIGLTGLVAASAPFQPTLSEEPKDWSVAIVYSGGGMSYPYSLAIDSLGNVWVSGIPQYGGFLAKLSPQGVPISPNVNSDQTGGYDLGNASSGPIAIDFLDNVWMPNTAVVGGGVVKVDNDGNLLSPNPGPGVGTQAGFAPGILSGPSSILVDLSDNVWVSNTSGVMVELNNAGTLLSPTTHPAGFNSPGYAIAATDAASAGGIVIDKFSNLWIANRGQDSLVSMNQEGTILTPPPTGLSGGGLDGMTNGDTPPIAVALDINNSILTLNNDSSGPEMSVFTSNYKAFSPDGGYYVGGAPSAMFVDSLNMVYISQPSINAVQVMDGSNLGNGSTAIYYNPEVNGPNGIVGDASGNLWVANFGSGFKGTVTELVGLINPTRTPVCDSAGNSVP